MDTRYSPLNHGGLEAVEQNNGMEVSQKSLDRSSALFSPGTGQTQNQTKEEHGNYYLGEAGSDATRTPYSELGKPTFLNSGYGEADVPL